MHYGKKTSWWSQCDVYVWLGVLGFNHPCGGVFATYHLPEHCCTIQQVTVPCHKAEMGLNPYSPQFTALKGSVANMLASDTSAHLQGSSRVQGLCSWRGTNPILGRHDVMPDDWSIVIIITKWKLHLHFLHFSKCLNDHQRPSYCKHLICH